jgi:hypothetical protein
MVATALIGFPLGAASQVPLSDIETPNLVMTPLGAELADLDFQTIDQNREYLRRIMGWGDWPADTLTVLGDALALENHRREFESGEAFAFGVLTPDRTTLLGCVYLYPSARDAGHVRLHYWVGESYVEADLDHLVLAEVLARLPEWGFATAELPVERGHERGVEVAVAAGLEQRPAEAWQSRLFFEWRGSER